MNSFLLVFAIIFATGSAQLAYIFAEQDEAACSTWESWKDAKCIWMRGQDGNKTDRWNQPYFSQLSPTCRENKFYKSVKKNYGDVLENAMNYFRTITASHKPCGYCSYKQVCGTGCTKESAKNVLERRCTSGDAGGFCLTDPQYYGTLVDKNCNLWPTKRVDLSSIRQPLRDFVAEFKIFNCVKGNNFLTARSCICCCKPFVPDLSLNKCVQRHSGGHDDTMGAGKAEAEEHDHGHTHDK